MTPEERTSEYRIAALREALSEIMLMAGVGAIDGQRVPDNLEPIEATATNALHVDDSRSRFQT